MMKDKTESGYRILKATEKCYSVSQVSEGLKYLMNNWLKPIA